LNIWPHKIIIKIFLKHTGRNQAGKIGPVVRKHSCLKMASSKETLKDRENIHPKDETLHYFKI
jgi:hypothetical protein